MPVETTWLYENRVLKSRHYGIVTLDQLVSSLKNSQQMTEDAHRRTNLPVHTIVDTRDMEGRADIGLGDLRKIIPRSFEGAGWTVALEMGPMERFIAAVGMQVAGARYKFVKDEAEAMRFLHEQDPTLSDVIR
jgi:hypothetical protein